MPTALEPVNQRVVYGNSCQLPELVCRRSSPSPVISLFNNSWTENHGVGRGRTIKAQWQNDRLLTVAYRAPVKALRRGSGIIMAKDRADTSAQPAICQLTSATTAPVGRIGEHTRSPDRLRIRETAASRRDQTPTRAPAPSIVGLVAYFHTLPCLLQSLIVAETPIPWLKTALSGSRNSFLGLL